MKIWIGLIITVFFVGCNTTGEKDESRKEDNTESRVLEVDLVELTDQEYPDNPDISIRHEKSTSTVMKSIIFQPTEEAFDLVFVPQEKGDDTVYMHAISLDEFIPTIPNSCKGDDYLGLISVVNQEWNRNQVRWTKEDLNTCTDKEFTVNGEVISRIDIARNCLNSYLWEAFFYTSVEGKDQVFYHGWFDFPKELYQSIYSDRNNTDFKSIENYMEDWTTPPSKKIELAKLREVLSIDEVAFESKNDEMYPLLGERKKKRIEVIVPDQFETMNDLLSDSTTFATFSIPGYYNRAEPRKTELGRFQKLSDVKYAKTSGGDEMQMTFERGNGEVTHFIFGGIDFSQLKKLPIHEANAGSAFSMGIGNHPFYETVTDHEKKERSTFCNPYFGVLLDENGNWLDSHAVGIDGPLLHLDENDSSILHIWILSFERHALVGHHVIQLQKEN